jgi:hypothetical protein
MVSGVALAVSSPGVPVALQAGLPDIVTDLVGLAGMLVLLLILAALGGFVYKSLTGGIEWPDEDDDETVTRSDEDDEWKFH